MSKKKSIKKPKNASSVNKRLIKGNKLVVSLAFLKEFYNNAVKDTLQELWLYDGIIPDADTRKELCTTIQKKISYKSPVPKSLNFKQP